jgi:hypothetical protein
MLDIYLSYQNRFICTQHRLTSSFEKGLHIFFPNFTTQAILGNHDIYLNATPSNETIKCTSFITQPLCESSMNSSAFCSHITQENIPSVVKTTRGDNILTTLREYYKDVKSKRQLNLEVPAGFRRECTLQRQNRDFTNSSNHPLIEDTSLDIFNDEDNILSPSTINNISSNSLTNESSNDSVPIQHCVDKPSSNLPSRITITEDFIRASVRFWRIETIKNQLPYLYQDTVLVDYVPADAVLDQGEFSNMRKTPRNTTPVSRPSKFGEVMHCDIVFGPDIAVGNVHYGLLFTDHYSRMTYLHPLQNLTSDLIKQLQSFFAHLGFSPHC